MGLTATEKILARAAGKPAVKPGEIVMPRVDRLLINDLLGVITFSQFESLGARTVWDPDRVLVAADHRVPPAEVKWAEQQKKCREYCKKYGIRFAEIGRHGIGHQLMVEDFTLPGEVSLGTDSHATMYGGLGALACGVTSSDAAVILATGKIWLQVPPSVRFSVSGALPRMVTAKDLALTIVSAAPAEEFIYKAIEIGGDCIKNMSVAGRLVICNMVAEMGAKNGIIPADEKTFEYLNMPADSASMVTSDPDAAFESSFEIVVSEMAPKVACPHSVDNVKDIGEVKGTPIQQAFLGSCTNGRLEDLIEAAEILKGKKVHPNVRLLVVPASQRVFLEATRMGLIEVFLDAGAAIMTPSCASCAGSGPGVIASGEACISTTNRNFEGRMGSPKSSVYLASAYTVAASAVAGVIEDPRAF
ncbi:MAG: 3-isopropylmalate dehydratase large subunit [Firmicutes bacterium]|nr:3-isopropylmalate dehydratase large subunit [Bacillota bacterium]